MGTSSENETKLFVDLGNGMFEYTDFVTVSGVVCTPNCKLFKIVTKKQLEAIVRRFVMILYSSSLSLDIENAEYTTSYNNIVKDVTEIASMLGVLDEVHEVLNSLMHVQNVVVDDEGMAINLE